MLNPPGADTTSTYVPFEPEPAAQDAELELPPAPELSLEELPDPIDPIDDPFEEPIEELIEEPIEEFDDPPLELDCRIDCASISG